MADEDLVAPPPPPSPAAPPPPPLITEEVPAPPMNENEAVNPAISRNEETTSHEEATTHEVPLSPPINPRKPPFDVAELEPEPPPKEGPALSAEEAFQAASWQARRDAWQSSTQSVSPEVLANSLGAESNANALDASFEGIAAFAAVASQRDLATFVSSGGVGFILKKGLGNARAATSKKAATAVENILDRGVDCVEDLIEGLGSDAKRGGGRLPTACARLLAKHLPEKTGYANALSGLFAAAGADARLAAAELVLALERRNATEAAKFIDGLGPSAKKAVERARAEAIATAPSSVVGAALKEKKEGHIVTSHHQEEEKKTSALKEEKKATWATSEDFWADVQAQAAAAGQSTASLSEEPLTDKKVVFESWPLLFQRPSWLARKEAFDVVARSFKKVTKVLAEDVSRSADDVIEAASFAALKESHAKVAPAAIDALAAIVSALGKACLPTAKSGVFPFFSDADDAKTMTTPLQRSKDKRFGPPIANLLAAFAKADPNVAFDSEVFSSVASLCQGPKKLPPFGRHLFLDWIGNLQKVNPKRAKRGLDTYLKLAKADAADAFPALRAAAASALATLVLVGDLPVDDALTNGDKRLKAKLDDLLAERRQQNKTLESLSSSFGAPTSSQVFLQSKKTTRQPKATTTTAAAAATKTTTTTVATATKAKVKERRPASAPNGQQLAATTRTARGSEPAQRSAAVDKNAYWYPSGKPDKKKAVALKEVVPTATRTFLGEQKDKDSWKKRREALERISTSFAKIAKSADKCVDGTSKDVKQMIVDLRPRLADAQAKLRPLACEALAYVLFAVSPRDVSARLGAKLAARFVIGAVLDQSRGVRKPAFYALDACVGHYETDEKTAVSPRALADAAPHLGAALSGAASPAAKPELLDWITTKVTKHLATSAMKRSLADDFDAHLVVPLLTLMNDKSKDCRDRSQICLANLVRHAAISPDAIVNAYRDMIPATKRALESRVDDILKSGFVDDSSDEEEDIAVSEQEEEGHDDSKKQRAPPKVSEESRPAAEVFKSDHPKVSLASNDEAEKVAETTPLSVLTIAEDLEVSKRGTTFEERGESARFSEEGTMRDSLEARISPPPPLESTEEETTTTPQTDEPVTRVTEIPAAFHFDPSVLEEEAPLAEERLSEEMVPKPEGNADELFDRALADLAEGAALEASQSKEALKAVVYFCSATSKEDRPHRTLSDPDVCEAAAATLARAVDRGVKALAKDASAAAQRFAKLSVVAALAFARSAALRRASIRELLRVATRRAAEPFLENDREIRAALNDLAVAAALDSPRGEALAAVLDLLASGGDDDDRLVTGQLARVVHLSCSDAKATTTTTTTDGNKSPKNSQGRFFWVVHNGRQNAADESRLSREEKRCLDADDDDTVASLVEPLVLASHAVLEDCKMDDAKRLVFDAAKTLVALLADTVGLDIILKAGKRGGLPKTSVMFEFAAKLADDSQSAARRVSRPTDNKRQQQSDDTTTTSLKERLHHIKRGRTPPPSARPRPTLTTASTTGDNNTDAAARIAELRRRLAASSAGAS